MERLFPRFVYDGKVEKALDVDPVKGTYKLEFRAADAVKLPPIDSKIQGIVQGKEITMRIGLGPGTNQRAITSCEGGYSYIRDVGLALGARHGDHLEFECEADGRYRITRADPAGIFFKLGVIQVTEDLTWTGLQTLEQFEENVAKYGFAWFGAKCGNFIKQERVEEYRRSINRGIPVKVYLATGTSGGGTGQVDYVADLVDLISGKTESEAPGSEVPAELGSVRCRTWLKLTAMKPVSLPLSDLVLARDLSSLERATSGQSAILYVRRIMDPPKPHAGSEPIILIGSSRNVSSYYDECRQFIADHGKLMYWWSFRIREEYQERLAKQGPFDLYLYEGKPVQKLTYRCKVEAFDSAPTPSPIPSPEPAFTLPAEQGETDFGNLSSRCWLRIVDFVKLDPPLLLADYVEYDRGTPIHTSALLSSFAYVRAKTAATPPAPPADAVAPPAPFVVQDLPAILEAFEQGQGLIFEDEDITNVYHALNALERKHFVILHGVSGTGKSEFAKAYTNALYGRPLADTDNPYFAMIAVQPTWQDRSPILGYYSPLDQSYTVPPFLRHVLAARSNPDRPYVICLDEMNLAVVEHYLADFLSAWESGKPIDLHARPEITDPPTELPIPGNLYVIGTVNMDETTHGFSPKVLDRAFTIEFSDVDVLRCGTLLVDQYPDHRTLIEETAALLDDLYKTLRLQGMHFAYRTVTEICRFMVANASGAESLDREVAWDRMILQKVLPRLRGDDRHAAMLDGLEQKLTARLGTHPGGKESRSIAAITRMKEDQKYGTFQFWR